MLHSGPLPGNVMVMVTCWLGSVQVLCGLRAVIAGCLQLAAALCLVARLLVISLWLCRCYLLCAKVAGHTAVRAVAHRTAGVAADVAAAAGSIAGSAGCSGGGLRVQPGRHHLVVVHCPPALIQMLSACFTACRSRVVTSASCWCTILAAGQLYGVQLGLTASADCWTGLLGLCSPCCDAVLATHGQQQL